MQTFAWLCNREPTGLEFSHQHYSIWIASFSIWIDHLIPTYSCGSIHQRCTRDKRLIVFHVPVCMFRKQFAISKMMRVYSLIIIWLCDNTLCMFDGIRVLRLGVTFVLFRCCKLVSELMPWFSVKNDMRHEWISKFIMCRRCPLLHTQCVSFALIRRSRNKSPYTVNWYLSHNTFPSSSLFFFVCANI